MILLSVNEYCNHFKNIIFDMNVPFIMWMRVCFFFSLGSLRFLNKICNIILYTHNSLTYHDNRLKIWFLNERLFINCSSHSLFISFVFFLLLFLPLLIFLWFVFCLYSTNLHIVRSHVDVLGITHVRTSIKYSRGKKRKMQMLN